MKRKTIEKFLYNYFEFIIVILVLLSLVVSHQGNADYFSFHYAAKLIDEGKQDQIYNPDLLNDRAEAEGNYAYPYIYPPFFASILIPLSRLDAHLSFWIYFTLLFPFLFLFFKFLKLIYLESASIDHLLFLIIASVLSSSTTRNLTLGQSNLIVFSLWLVSVYHYKKDRHLIPSLFLAISIMIKLLPVVSLLILFFNKKHIDVLLTVFFCILLTILSIAISGIDIWILYIKNFFSITGFSTGDTGIRMIFELLMPSIRSFWIIIPLTFICLLFLIRKNLDLTKGWALSSVVYLIGTPLLWAVSILPFFTILAYYPDKLKSRFIKIAFYSIGIISVMRYSLYSLFIYRIIPLMLIIIIVSYFEIHSSINTKSLKKSTNL